METTNKKSRSETGHMKNVMNFEDLLARLRALKERYNPTHPNLQLRNMEALQQEAHLMFEELTAAETLHDQATNARADLFAMLPPFATRIISLLRACAVDDKTIEDAMRIQRKIQGKRAPGRRNRSNGGATPTNGTENGETPADNTRSTAQLSYDLKIEHFERLLALIKLVPSYQPNEEELKVTAMEAFLQQLYDVNTRKTHADAALETARGKRQRVLYDPETGLVPRAKLAKAYVKAVLGATNEEFKHIQRIRFSMRK